MASPAPAHVSHPVESVEAEPPAGLAREVRRALERSAEHRGLDGLPVWASATQIAFSLGVKTPVVRDILASMTVPRDDPAGVEIEIEHIRRLGGDFYRLRRPASDPAALRAPAAESTPAAEPGDGLFTLPELARLTGAEYRTMHLWVERGALCPSARRSDGTGTPSLFTAEDAVETIVLTDLRAFGIEFDHVREIAPALRATRGHRDGPLLHICMADAGLRVRQVSRDELAGALRYARPALVYDLTRARRTVRDALEARR